MEDTLIQVNGDLISLRWTIGGHVIIFGLLLLFAGMAILLFAAMTHMEKKQPELMVRMVTTFILSGMGMILMGYGLRT